MQGMHSFIVTGDHPDRWTLKTLAEHSVSPHDTITIAPEGSSISINEIRGISSRLSIHPFASACHAVIIRDAHTMTTEAQNAFLKTLEEPPGDAVIILETSQPDALLPTILSRCHLVRLPTSATSDASLLSCFKTLEHLASSSIGNRLQIIDSIAKTKGDALTFVNCAITALHPKLQSNEAAKLLRGLLTARTHLLGNITPKLALDAVFL